MDNQILNIKPKKGYGFIYCYTSPSGKRYIGQTRTTLKEKSKKNAKGYKGCKYFYKAIQKYGFENFTVEILEETPIDTLNEAEIYYIIYYDTINRSKGYNICLEHYNLYRVYSKIPVYAYDMYTGDFIKDYCSIPQAEMELGVHRGSVRRVINEPTHRCRGMLWMTEKFDKIEIKPGEVAPHSKSIYMYDSKTGHLLKEFESIREASRQTGYNRCTIQEQAVRNKVQSGKKHSFRAFKVDNLYDESSTTFPGGVGSSELKEK